MKPKPKRRSPLPVALLPACRFVPSTPCDRCTFFCPYNPDREDPLQPGRVAVLLGLERELMRILDVPADDGDLPIDFED